jgi:hypothetical protein
MISSKEEVLSHSNFGMQCIGLGGGMLQNFYNNSQSLALTSLFPDEPWQPWRFSHTPQYFWNSSENNRIFLDWIAEKLNVNLISDWYNVRHYKVLEISDMVHLSPLSTMLSIAYKDTHWQFWRFEHVPKVILQNYYCKILYDATLNAIGLLARS